MAKSGPKKRYEENRKKLEFLSRAVNVPVGAHFLLRLIVRRKSAVWWHWMLFLITAFASRLSFTSLQSWAKPSFGPNGELLDGGESLSGGLTEYYQDLIYVSAFALVGSTYSDWFWLSILIVPGVATYMIATKFVIPWFLSTKQEAAAPTETKEEKRRRERQERRAAKRFR